jgi:hypothetical protein
LPRVPPPCRDCQAFAERGVMRITTAGYDAGAACRQNDGGSHFALACQAVTRSAKAGRPLSSKVPNAETNNPEQNAPATLTGTLPGFPHFPLLVVLGSLFLVLCSLTRDLRLTSHIPHPTSHIPHPTTPSTFNIQHLTFNIPLTGRMPVLQSNRVPSSELPGRTTTDQGRRTTNLRIA